MVLKAVYVVIVRSAGSKTLSEPSFDCFCKQLMIFETFRRTTQRRDKLLVQKTEDFLSRLVVSLRSGTNWSAFV